jgi:hypothetical protein
VLVFYGGSASYKIMAPSGSVLATAINVSSSVLLANHIHSIAQILIEAWSKKINSLVHCESPNPSIIHMLDRAKDTFGGTYSSVQVIVCCFYCEVLLQFLWRVNRSIV